MFAVAVCLFLNVYAPAVPTDFNPFCPTGNTNPSNPVSFNFANELSSNISPTPDTELFVSAPDKLYSVDL